MEIERKWLVNKGVKHGLRVKCKYVANQFYLSVEPEVRVRSVLNTVEGEYGFCECRLTIKGKGDLSRQEIEYRMSIDEFRQLLEIGHVKDCEIINKKCMDLEYGNYTIEFSTVDEGTPYEFSYVEIEFNSEEEAKAFVAPDWFGKEVTYDSRYKMKNYWKLTRGSCN